MEWSHRAPAKRLGWPALHAELYQKLSQIIIPNLVKGHAIFGMARNIMPCIIHNNTRYVVFAKNPYNPVTLDVTAQNHHARTVFLSHRGFHYKEL